jgi:hypothetical protein
VPSLATYIKSCHTDKGQQGAVPLGESAQVRYGKWEAITKMKTLITHLKTKSALAVAVFAAFFIFVAAPLPAYAACGKDEQEISLPVDQGGTKCIPINERTTDIAENPIFFYLRNILVFMAGGVGLAVVGGIIYGAYMYITARGNASQTQQGQNIIINAVIGLLMFIFMYAILQFLIPGGIIR